MSEKHLRTIAIIPAKPRIIASPSAMGAFLKHQAPEGRFYVRGSGQHFSPAPRLQLDFPERVNYNDHNHSGKRSESHVQPSA